MSVVAVLNVQCETAKQYAVEVLVVLDRPSSERWEATATSAGNVLDQEVRSLMHEVNLVYRGLTSQGLDIHIRLADDRVMYVDEDIVCRKRATCSNRVDSVMALQLFHGFTMALSVNFDLALFFSGHDFSDPVVGRAELGGVCKRGVAIVAPFYGIAQVQNIAHEIGHLLGLRHDGAKDACSSHHGFVMRKNGSPLDPNAHFFSSCSADALASLLSKFDCLSPENSVSIVSTRFGHLVGADETCRRANGKHLSRYNYYNGNYMGLCRSLMCEQSLYVRSDVHFNVAGIPARTPDGMQCGSKRACHGGKCVLDPSVNVTWNKHCPFGDTPGPISRDITSCQVARRRGKCIFPLWKDVCCVACFPKRKLPFG
ncbi:A disintegrin and metalloproteinase with thrombospondin motifs 1 [Elysia marginata]|uniref:A disintegrin and metalloproteinase with thrombospondin motifs 1 n=1 Tax=Elysia marginata TaxID=1093978 RepID=A0AAV4JT48_9GAST|nr:A disintegrin and metalloproteinase with thrombospondin motifs 1 [Elysia marginata]